MLVQNINEFNGLTRPFFERYNIVRAAVFGSFARGKNKKNSDVDLLVSFGDKYDLWDIIGLKQDLEETLGRKVDLLTYASLNKDCEFSQMILKEAKIIYEKN
jgi:predicted nucleotidyltransferase